MILAADFAPCFYWTVLCFIALLGIEFFEEYPVHRTAKKKSAAHNTCWKNFSRYIRLRDAINTTGTMTHARCITCGAMHEIEDMDAGHMIPRRTNGILFDESMVFAQCHTCNRDKGGEEQAFKRIMIERKGEAWYDLKVQARSTPTKLTDDVLRLMNGEWLAKIKRLKAQFEAGEN